MKTSDYMQYIYIVGYLFDIPFLLHYEKHTLDNI